jgi:hypothetical protein
MKESQQNEFNEDIITSIYNKYYKEFSYFFNLMVQKKKINLDKINEYFNIAISNKIIINEKIIDESYKTHLYNKYLN